MDHSGAMATVHPTRILETLRTIKERHPGFTPQMAILFDELEELEFQMFHLVIPILLYREINALKAELDGGDNSGSLIQ
jgi:hypothetical protein